ncbi:30S ribosomal protein S27 [Thermodesulfobacteriota bacterium]
MSVIFQTIINTILHLKRTCPKCKRDQIVPPSKRKETVRCKFCKADIPPAK